MPATILTLRGFRPMAVRCISMEEAQTHRPKIGALEGWGEPQAIIDRLCVRMESNRAADLLLFNLYQEGDSICNLI